MTYFVHERAYRDIAAAAGAAVTICGAGALGANLAETLARMGFRQLRVIDRDRVAAHNLSTQPWTQGDVGASKARVLAAALSRAVGARVDAQQIELREANARRLLDGSALVVDAFDNLPSRRAAAAACRDLRVACLHIALAATGDYGCGAWDDGYREAAGLGDGPPAGDEICDYPLTRPLALLVAAAAAEVIVARLLGGPPRGFELTLRDLRLAAN